jgi:hypothetical protein
VSKGTIKFETTTSESLSCTCGNDVMDSGFDTLEPRFKNDLRYVCNSCGAMALVDFAERVVLNEMLDAVR